jgi:sigma54-dependent transcription regulator
MRQLLESELFGYCKGSFTGATKDEPGLFRQAHESTLFLDEVADMSFEMQKRLLRVIEEGEVVRLAAVNLIAPMYGSSLQQIRTSRNSQNRENSARIFISDCMSSHCGFHL